MKLLVFKDNEQNLWESFRGTCPGNSFLQSWIWGQFQKNYGYEVLRLGYEEKGQLCSIAQCLKYDLRKGGWYWYSPRGPLWVGGAPALAGRATCAFRDELRRRADAVFWRVDPLISGLEKMGSNAFREMQPRETLQVDLTKSAEEILSQLKPKTRYNIRLAQKKGVTISNGHDSVAVSTFCRLARETSRRDHFHYHRDEYYQKLLETMGPIGAAEVVVASFDREPLAANIIIYDGEDATYAHGASAERHRELMAPQFLQWECISRARQRGAKIYDFYGIATRGAQVKPWQGITRFKEGFAPAGSTTRIYQQYPAARDFPFQPTLYRALKILSKFR